MNDGLGFFRGVRNILILAALAGLGAALAALTGCSASSPIGTGFEAHRVDMPIETPTVIYVLRADQAQEACAVTTAAVNGLRTEAMGCSTLMPDGSAFRHVIICPPSWVVCLHEARHATKDGDWH